MQNNELTTSHLDRRAVLGLLGGLSLTAILAACGSDSNDGNSTSTSAAGTNSSDSSTSADSSTSSTAPSSDTTCTTIPGETAGPFPGDGSNGPDVLTLDGVVRSDITTSFDAMSGTADGVPCTIELTIVDAADGCTPMPGAAVYAWHCDAEGRYSLYSEGATDQNYLRGVQVADDSGVVRFASVFPGCYSGRWPHVHFEVYPDETAATSQGTILATSQLAFPEAESDTVFADSRYPSSASNFAQISLDSDGVFGDDGGVHQIATMTGDVASGYTARLTVGV